MFFFRIILVSAVVGLTYTPMMKAQNSLGLPTFNEALSGHRAAIKIPSPKDLDKFTKDYQSHLAMLAGRSEKAYRKAFLKFIDIEDELLMSLCDSNEFRANMLMRSAMASYGKIQADMQTKTAKQQKPFYQKENALRAAASLSGEVLPNDEQASFENSMAEHRAKTVTTGSNLYAAYMSKRVRIYDHTFENGTKKQRKLLRKLKRKAWLWQAFKMEDRNLIGVFADKHHGIVKYSKRLPGFESGMAASMPDYTRALAKAANSDMLDVANIGGADMLSALKERIASGGILSDGDMENVDNAGELLDMAREKMNSSDKENNESQKRNSKERKEKLPNETVKAKRFWDRLYGGVDFNWENPTGYYPEGLGLVLTGGYKISNDAGINLEVNTLFNGSKMGLSEDDRFRSTLVSNYSMGANADYRAWKFIFVGAGAEVIVNRLEAPIQDYRKAIQDAEFTVGLPVILRLIAPISALSGTNVEIRYDFNAKHNIKPNFDFRVGFLIGRL